ncbi:MAG TPA: 3-oxoacyl-[acyl-carrier-protein] reductase [Firmicutes bacterium]|nr:3-oxoacyl-[acyl-carrier-protein] reductase [Bacillota bacterium]
MELAQQVAVITGGARGIGRAIALELARRGAWVVVNYASSRGEAEQVVAEIKARGGEAVGHQADVASLKEACGLVEAALALFGTVDILVNNAGIARDNLLLRMKEEEWDQVLQVNLKGVFNCTKASLRPMLKQRRGRIINISSVIGLAGNVAQANYAAAKAGIIGFTKAVAKEVAPRGITVNAVAPGFIATDMTASLPAEIQEEYRRRIPLGRSGTAADVARVVAFLASPAADYITGEVIRVDGGLAI